jgi:AcrR family transcriptional regulator
MTAAAVPAPSRRAVRYQRTTDEIKAHARDQLRADGAAALSLRAVAREMGMASSAMYRYFPSREHLLTALCSDAYDSLGAAMADAVAAAGRCGPPRRWWVMAHAMRAWSLAHTEEFGLIFGAPVPGHAAAPDETGPAASRFMTPPLEIYLAAVRDGSADPAVATCAPVLGIEPLLRYFIDQVEPDYPPRLATAVLAQLAAALGAISWEAFGAIPKLVASPDDFWAAQVRSGMVALGFAPAAVRRLS